MQEGDSSVVRPKAWWRPSRRGLWLLLALALVVAVGGAALAQAAGSGDTNAGTGSSGGQSDQSAPSRGGAGGGPRWRGGPGRCGMFAGLWRVCGYLDMEAAEVRPLVKEHGAKRVLLAAPLAKLSDKPLGDVLDMLAKDGSWTEVAGDLKVDLDKYFNELENVLGPVGPRQPKQAPEGSEQESGTTGV